MAAKTARLGADTRGVEVKRRSREDYGGEESFGAGISPTEKFGSGGLGLARRVERPRTPKAGSNDSMAGSTIRSVARI